MRTWLQCSRKVSSIDHYRTILTTLVLLLISSNHFLCLAGFGKSSLEWFRVCGGSCDLHTPKLVVLASSVHLSLILVSSIPFIMLDYQFDWTLFLVKYLWQEGGNNLCGYYICEFIYNSTPERGYSDEQYEVRKQYSQFYFITINWVEFHSYICIDPLL